MPSSTFDRVVHLLDEAVVSDDPKKKAANILQVQELIIHKERSLLDNFLEEVLAFQNDKNADVRKAVVNFIEEACKHDYEVLPKAVQRLAFLIDDTSVNVLKRVVSCMMTIYRLGLTWAVRTKGVKEEAGTVFKQLVHFKEKLLKLLHGPNDGVRMLIIKFIETIIIIQTRRHPESEIPKLRENDISLDQITAKAADSLKVDRLESEAYRLMEDLMKYLNRGEITSVNLQTLMGSLTIIAKQRPQFMNKAVQGFETIHVNLPPNLAPSQVSSVRKTLKNQLLVLLRHPSSYEYQAQITTLLTDLGATQAEVLKALPKSAPSTDETRNRRQERNSDAGGYGVSTSIAGVKRSREEQQAKDEENEEDDGSMLKQRKLLSMADKTPFISLSDSVRAREKATSRIPSIDETAQDLIVKLTPANVTDLVLLSMVMLPEEMPPAFQSTYTPIAAAGTDAQMKHLSRLLSAQLLAAGLVGPKGSGPEPSQEEEDGGMTPMPSAYQQSTNFKMPLAQDPNQMVNNLLMQAGQLQADILTNQQRDKRVARTFNLERVTERLSKEVMEELAISSYHRVLSLMNFEEQLNHEQQPLIKQIRARILTALPASFGGELYAMLCDFCLSDLKPRFHLLSQLVYTEYARWKGFHLPQNAEGIEGLSTEKNYDAVFTQLLTRLTQPDINEIYFRRLMLEAPVITSGAQTLFHWYCSQPESAQFGCDTLYFLLTLRPHLSSTIPSMVSHFLELTCKENQQVRHPAIGVARKLYQLDPVVLKNRTQTTENTETEGGQEEATITVDYKQKVEKFSKLNLKKLLRPRVSGSGASSATSRITEWTEESSKPCLYLFLALMPLNHRLLFTLAKVYVKAVAPVKRAILRMLEGPVKEIGMESPQILTLVENCPKGSETLLTRIIHILTDRNTPSKELVDKVRELYHKRVPDVRFLIPVLKGLSKSEIIAALPKLIQLNEKVVKEVFNRLLSPSDLSKSYAISPEDLLVAIHLLEFQKDPETDKPVVDLKTIMQASQLCFAERQAYTQERLSIAIGQLLDQSNLSTLFMRTVMQSLAMYPRLTGYVVNVLTSLIRKQIWKNNSLWDGFILCCVKIRPQSFQVLLQLPPEKLETVFTKEPELRPHVKKYVDNFSSQQKSHISKAILSVLEAPPPPAEKQKTTTENGQETDAAARAQEILKRKKLRQFIEQEKPKLSFLPKVASASQNSDDKETGKEPETEESPDEKDKQSEDHQEAQDEPTEQIGNSIETLA